MNMDHRFFQGSNAVLVDTSGERRRLIRKALNELGFEIKSELDGMDSLVAKVQEHKPDTVVIGIDVPDQMTFDALVAINDTAPCPVIMFAEHDTPVIINKVIECGVSAFVVNDFQAVRLSSIISIAKARFDASQALRLELESTREKLAERKVLERAKGILMRNKGMDEEQAFQCLRKSAMDSGKTISAVASNIVEVFNLIESPLTK